MGTSSNLSIHYSWYSGWINKTQREQYRKEPGSEGGEGWVYSTLQNRKEDQRTIWNLPVPVKKPRIMPLSTGNSP